MAYNSTSIGPHLIDFKPYATTEYVRAVQFIKHSISDPNVTQGDSFLIAISLRGIW